MSASTDPATSALPAGSQDPDPGGRASPWRPAGVLYLVVCLASLVLGLWPETLFPTRADVRTAPLPALQTLAAGQAGFVLLAYPLIVLGRCRGGPMRRYWLGAALESAVYLLVGIPFYVAGAFLADAVAADVVRAAVYVACLWPVGWSAGAWVAQSRGSRAVVFLMLLWAVLIMPAAYYVMLEFHSPLAPGRWVWEVAPVTFAWQTAASRSGGLFPSPLWAALVWPILAAAAAILRTVMPRMPERRIA